MIYGIIIWLITLVIDLWTDVRLWYKKKKVNHVRGALLRLLGLIPACYFAKWFAPVLLFAFWISFNGFYNILTGQKWFRKGTTAKLDKLPVWVPYVGLVASVIVWYVMK